MVDFGMQFLSELVGVFLEASPYILLGFVVAAGIQILLPVQLVQQLFGQGRVRPIVVAALLGIPLPLCSCSVLPTALALRRRGASRGATVSFLVSTPETGIDSIALTWGLMDPLMAIFRPFAALVTALTAGFAAEFGGGDDGPKDPAKDPAKAAASGEADSACAADPDGHDHTHDKLEEEERRAESIAGVPWMDRLREGFRGAFVEIFDETSHWMLGGLAISALIMVLLPAEIVTEHLSSGPVPMLLMLVIGIPLYICASASTPIAAALVLKGLSPGAALVFLLAGPATNIGSLAILSRALGRRVMTIYIVTISVLSLALGALLNAIYSGFQIDPRAIVGELRGIPMSYTVPAALIFATLLFFSFRRVAPPSEFRKLWSGLEMLFGFRLGRRFAGVILGAAALLALFSLCTVRVPPGHQGLVQRFGAPRGPALGEGLHLKLPPPFERARVIRTGVRRIEVGFRSSVDDAPAPLAPGPARATRGLEEESVFLTGDENLLATQSVLQYRVNDAARFAWGFRDPERTLKLETIAQTLDVLASRGIDGVYTDDRREVELQILEGVRERAAAVRLGVEVLAYTIRNVHAPPEVHAAFRDVASAQEDKQTAINVALRFLDETVNLARGEAARLVEEAGAERVTWVLRAQGESQSLLLRSEAYREQPGGTSTRLYLETVEEVLAGSRKIIRPGWSGSGGVDLWISRDAGRPSPVADLIRGSDVRANRSGEGR